MNEQKPPPSEVDDPFYILPFLRRSVTPKSEFAKMNDTTETTEAPVKKAPAKAKGEAKAAPAKAAAKAPAKVKAAPAKGNGKTVAKAAPAKGEAKVKAKKASKVERDAYGFRANTVKAKAAALYARKEGATVAEVKKALGSVQLNLLKALEAEGYKVIKKKEEGVKGGRANTRYFLKSK